ncbi:F-box only protein 4 isoform X1 [Polypterus senegalus]|nr:F-box only protein 4 isoform X1 [Polypterus senegalus]
MAVNERGGWESVVIESLRSFRDRYLQSVRNVSRSDHLRRRSHDEAPANERHLERLPIDLHLYIMSFLSPQDLCHLSCTSHYWNSTVHDPLLWRYFLLRDIPLWSSVNHNSLPDLEVLTKTSSELLENANHDYMSQYLKSCPECRRYGKPNRPVYGAVTSFFHSLVVNTEPRFAMFGPGLEQLDVSLLTKMMYSPEVLPVAGLPQRQINGIGSGISFMFKNQQKLNIITLYSAVRKERERARTEQSNIQNPAFLQGDERATENCTRRYTVIPLVENVCSVVDGFIYVANAESNRSHERENEFEQIQAMLYQPYATSNRPLLVLSCISRAGVNKIPSIYMAHELHLNKLSFPWLVQDTEAETLIGLLDGIEWLLRESGINV